MRIIDEELIKNNWIPIKTRPLTDDEEHEYASYSYPFIYDCKLPEDRQEVLITEKYGNVVFTTFYAAYGCYFEGYEDEYDVLAWMPLPEPYKRGDEDDRTRKIK